LIETDEYEQDLEGMVTADIEFDSLLHGMPKEGPS
jgi:hypothetical protein